MLFTSIYLGFTSWRPGARHHLLKVERVPYHGDVDQYETLCGRTGESTMECATMATDHPATPEEIDHEHSMPNSLCVRCYYHWVALGRPVG